LDVLGRGVCLVLLLGAAPALAVQYEANIDVASEQDLYDLAARNEISDETLETLVELMDDGVDLNSASREDLYALPNLTYAEVDAIIQYRRSKGEGRIEDPAELVTSGALTAATLVQIAPFLLIVPDGAHVPISGKVRVQSRYTAGDALAPPAVLRTTLRGPYDLSFGLGMLTARTIPGPVTYDKGRNALTAELPAYSIQVPKFFLQWKSQNRSAILGTFRIGFGQRLTLDNTTRYTPDGFYADATLTQYTDLTSLCRQSAGELPDSPCAGDLGNTYVTPDYSWRPTFRGVAGSIKDLGIGETARLSLHGFLSYQDKSAYQYALVDRGVCSDPRNDDDLVNCLSPLVYVKQPNPGTPTSRFSYTTLPGVYDELAGGGNIKLELGPRVRIGTTAYYAMNLWRVEGINLDLQEWSAASLYNGPFGAVGVDGALSLGELNFFAELTRTFDSLPGPVGGGGIGVLQRSTYSLKKQEIELSFRYYQKNFANPRSRPISAPDQFEGRRARNEAGARLTYLGKPVDDWSFRAFVDAWILPEDMETPGTAGTANLYGLLRADFLGWRFFQPAALIDYRNKDLGKGGHGQCYADTQIVILGEPQPCSGEYYRVAGRFKFQPADRLTLTLQYAHEFLDDVKYTDRFRQDMRVSGDVAYAPTDSLRLKARTTFLNEAIGDAAYGGTNQLRPLEKSLWSWVSVTWLASRPFQVTARYDLYAYLDERPSTLLRIPRPEHRFRLDIESKF
jgi:hypothetical protein